MARKPVTLASFSWDATPERLAKAANDNGYITTETPEGGQTVARRVVDWPLAQLAARGMLAPGEPEVNATLAAAGERLCQEFHNGQRSIRAIDYGRVRVDGGSAGLQAAEFSADCAERYRRAAKAAGRDLAVLERVVLHEQPPALSDIAPLRRGLRAVAVYFRLLHPPVAANDNTRVREVAA